MAGMLYSRIHSRQFTDMGGFWLSAPRMGGFLLAFSAAAFGLPGLVNFVGEFMSLLGAFQVYPVAVMFAALGLISSAVYGLMMFQQSFHGVARMPIVDLSGRELMVCSILLLFLLLFGLKPNLLLQPLHVHHQQVVLHNVKQQPVIGQQLAHSQAKQGLMIEATVHE
jgi:NADH-quinone oxidoreductase subunit M